MRGTEWLIDARGCEPSALRDKTCIGALLDRIIVELQLTPVAPAAWHLFPPPGGITAVVMLAESHLACHTFPEHGSICLNVFCCRPRGEWDPRPALAEVLAAEACDIRRVERDYSPLTAPVAPDLLAT